MKNKRKSMENNWKSMKINRKSKKIYENQWKSIENQWKSTENQWKSMEINWKSMENNWKSKKINWKSKTINKINGNKLKVNETVPPPPRLTENRSVYEGLLIADTRIFHPDFFKKVARQPDSQTASQLASQRCECEWCDRRRTDPLCRYGVAGLSPQAS